jgi:hypothetical protein
MKKTVLLLVLGLASFSLSAQSRMTYSWEFVAGVGVGKGPHALFTPEFVAQYDLGCGFRIGAGAGTRFGRPCLQYITKNGAKSRSFTNELDIPVFMRLGYGKEKLYVQVDAGYAIGILGFPGVNYDGPGLYSKDFPYNGLFVEPQIGWKVGRRSALALGLLFQQSTVSNHVTTETGTMNDPSYSIKTKVNTLNIFTPAVTLRYVLGF